MAQLVLLPGKDRSLARRHPWIFAAAVERLSGRVRPGDTVEVLAANGRPLAKAAWSRTSQGGWSIFGNFVDLLSEYGLEALGKEITGYR